MSCEPNQLIYDARCLLQCIPPGLQSAAQTALLDIINGGPTPVNTLVQNSKEFIWKVPPRFQLAIQIYLMLVVLEGQNRTVEELLRSASCMRCIPQGLHPPIQTYEICQWSNNLTPGACSHPVVTDWANRVVANGDPAPTAEVYAALCNFMRGMDLAGLTDMMFVVNPFAPATAPGGIITATTPLIVGAGAAQWSNLGFFGLGFTNASVTVNGVQGDGDAYMMTGLNAIDIFTRIAVGITVYRHATGVFGFPVETGVNELAGGDFANIMVSIHNPIDNEVYWDCSNNLDGEGRLHIENPVPNAYHSFNRLAEDNSRVYQANGGTAHHVLGHIDTNGGNTPFGYDFAVFAHNDFDGTGGVVLISDSELSFIAYHEPLTLAQSEEFYDLVQQLRIDLGGGWN